MKRKALIIYCDNTGSGKLPGPIFDNQNFRNFLTSKLGGQWYDHEILSLQNPTKQNVNNAINYELSNSDYTFIVFTGHGFMNLDDHNKQYIELLDANFSIFDLKTTAKRQTIIIDACRGLHSPLNEKRLKNFNEFINFSGQQSDTRLLFESAIMRADEGLTVLFAASENQTALDTIEGAAYLLSLLRVAEVWSNKNELNNILSISDVHNKAIPYLAANFQTIQNPKINIEKRNIHFPFAVKKSKFIV